MRIKLKDHHDGYYDIGLLTLIGASLWLYDIKIGDYYKHGEEGPLFDIHIWNPLFWFALFVTACIDLALRMVDLFIGFLRNNKRYKDAERLSRRYLWRLCLAQVKDRIDDFLDFPHGGRA